jgi:hypothetical protein
VNPSVSHRSSSTILLPTSANFWSKQSFEQGKRGRVKKKERIKKEEEEEKYLRTLDKDDHHLSVLEVHSPHHPTACSFGWWLMAGAGLL